MPASDLVSDSSGGFSRSTYPTKTLPRSEMLHVGDCELGHWPTFYTVIHKKCGSTFVIITLEKLV